MIAISVIACVAIGLADAYQAITGNRLSKRPSRRSDARMRRQSAIAAVVLLGLATAAVLLTA